MRVGVCFTDSEGTGPEEEGKERSGIGARKSVRDVLLVLQLRLISDCVNSRNRTCFAVMSDTHRRGPIQFS
jgi:hypothetical protein